MRLLLTLPATLLLSIVTINHQSVDALKNELRESSSEPKDCSINVDYISEYPPYFQLNIINIINQNGNRFPDNLLIAIKADKGRLTDGQSVDGWYVYSTTGACITEKIKYIPPTCEISKDDILSFAAVYKTEGGTMNMGSVNFTKKIINPICLDAVTTARPKDTLKPEDPVFKPGESAWTGTIHLEINQILSCDVEYLTESMSRNRVFADDKRRTIADIEIELTDFDLPKLGTSAGAKLQNISGMVTVDMQENQVLESNHEKTQCHNDISGRWEWVSPGNWEFLHETMAGHATLEIRDGGLNLLIVKEMLGDKDAMQNMQQKYNDIMSNVLVSSNIMDYEPDLEPDNVNSMYNPGALSMDKQALEKLKDDMRDLMQGEQNTTEIPIKVSLTILTPGNRNYSVSTTHIRKAYDVCKGEQYENENRHEIIQLPLMPPVSAEMKGSYTLGKNGNDRIDASIDDLQPYHATFGSDICPDGTIIIKGTILLERNKDQ